MSRAGEITLAFGGEERPFRLPIGRLRALQERCDAGPLELLNRLQTGTWRVDDVRETLLQGLIGGGADQAVATKLIIRFFDDQPLMAFPPMAQLVMLAAVVGSPDEDEAEAAPVGEPQAPETNPSPEENSVSGASMATARRSASTHASSTT